MGEKKRTDLKITWGSFFFFFHSCRVPTYSRTHLVSRMIPSLERVTCGLRWSLHVTPLLTSIPMRNHRRTVHKETSWGSPSSCHMSSVCGTFKFVSSEWSWLWNDRKILETGRKKKKKKIRVLEHGSQSGRSRQPHEGDGITSSNENFFFTILYLL